MSNVRTTISKSKANSSGQHKWSKTAGTNSLPSKIKQRLEVLNKAPTSIYQREGSKVYTVVCIACVGVTLIGLGGGLIVYAQDLGVYDLVVIGGFGIFIGMVSLIAALTFLFKPILERRRRNVAVAATVQKQRNISVAAGTFGYVYRNDSDVDVEKATTPSAVQLYDLQKRPSSDLQVAYPTDKADLPTYNVKVQHDSDSEERSDITETGL